MAETQQTIEVTSERAALLVGTISADLSSACRERMPLDRYMDAAAIRDPYRYCEHLPPAQVRIAQRLARAFAADFDTYQRIAIAELVRRRLAAPEFSALPHTIQARSLAWFSRILDEVETAPPNHFDWRRLDAMDRSDRLKDFAVAAGRALPLQGAWIVERRRHFQRDLFSRPERSAPGAARGGTGRKPVFRLLDPLRRLRRAGREWLGRYGDYLVIHTSYRYRRQFSPRYMERAYHDLAALLRLDADIVGVYRKSWFLDPALADVEPRLTFLRTVPEAHGAEVHRLGPVHPDNRPEILAFSASRREAFDRGEYRPFEWAYLWRRGDVLRWADEAVTSVAG